VPFDAQPILQGKRLELRPLRRADWEALYAVASDPLIWEQHPARNRHELEVFRAFFDEALAGGTAFVVVDRANGLVIGSSRFHGYDEAKSEVEIGWTFLARLYWGGVYNGELKQLMLEHAFRFVDSVIFVVGPRNLRSQRAVEKLGAVLTTDEPPRDERGLFVSVRHQWVSPTGSAVGSCASSWRSSLTSVTATAGTNLRNNRNSVENSPMVPMNSVMSTHVGE